MASGQRKLAVWLARDIVMFTPSLETPEADAAAPEEGAAGLVLSLAFWLSLVVAAGLFAMGTLSPKVVTGWRHAAELERQTARVSALAGEVERLEREAHALESDPDYLAARARQDLGLKPEGTRLIKVLGDAPLASVVEEPVEPVESPAPFLIWVQRVAGDSLLRARMLTVAAALVLFGFAFLHERRRVAG
jgi:cell division protein FtsB